VEQSKSVNMIKGFDPDNVRHLAGDIAFQWAAGFPADRFTGDTVDNARMSVTSVELVDLVEHVLKTAREQS
jgi:hypothetical protein